MAKLSNYIPEPKQEYDVENQRRVLVASQRLGFIDLIDGATSKWALQYKAS